MHDINNMSARSGRTIKESGAVINLADIMDAVYDAVNGVLKTSASVELGVTSLPAGNLGQQSKTASLSVVPASDIPDATYLGDIKFGEALPAGTNLLGKVGIDQSTDGTTNKVQARNATHDDFNGNANLQIGNTDVGNANPVPVDIRTIQAGDNNIGNVDVVTLPSLPAGTNQVGKVGYTLKKVSVNFTRPSDTTNYAIGDAMSDSTSAPSVFQLDLSSIGAVNGQSVEIRKVAVVSSAKQSTLPLINVYLSNTTFTATNDNSALDIDDTTMEAGGSWFQCDTQNYTASNSRVSNLGINEPMILAAADNKLYGTLQAANAYTPVSGEKFTIIIWVALL